MDTNITRIATWGRFDRAVLALARAANPDAPRITPEIIAAAVAQATAPKGSK